jgi:hypothetical protein
MTPHPDSIYVVLYEPNIRVTFSTKEERDAFLADLREKKMVEVSTARYMKVAEDP